MSIHPNTLVLFSLLIVSCDAKVEVPCISDTRCPDGLICLQGVCVNDQLSEGSPRALYRQEFHLRLASDCGVCHGVSESPRLSAPSAEEGRFALPELPVAPEDGGWRIYLDKLNDARLEASFQDTIEQLNSAAPEESPLLLYGLGAINLLSAGQEGGPLAHPRLYSATPENIPYQRLLAWVKRWAAENPAPPPPPGLDLELLKDELYPTFQRDCLACHLAPGGIGGFSLPGEIQADDDGAWDALESLLSRYIDGETPKESPLYLLVINAHLVRSKWRRSKASATKAYK